MKPRLRPSLLPQCSSCARTYLEAGYAGWRPFQQQQTRGAKSARNQPDTIPVQLKAHVDGFGKAGSFVPISVGEMRNRWFPSGKARYVVGDDLRAIRAGKLHVERDPDFSSQKYKSGLKAKEKAELRAAYDKAKEEARRARIVARQSKHTAPRQQLSPQRSLDLLAVLLPAKMEFHRAVVEAGKQEQKPSSLPAEVTAILSQGRDKAAAPVPIYGSISAADVAAYIREYVAYNDEASQVVLHDGGIRFAAAGALEESGRVKHLGEYDIAISIKGAEGVVKRKVVVLAQQAEPDVQEESEQEEPVKDEVAV